MPRIPPIKKPVNIAGRRFDALVAIDYRAADNKWRCRCDCGTEVYRRFCDINSNLRRGSRCTCHNCRVWKPNKGTTGLKFGNRGDNLVGMSFGALTVISEAARTRSGSLWNCLCACGNESVVQRITSQLKKVKNPGCKDCEGDRRAAVHLTHGGAYKGVTRLYAIWKGMLARCRDHENPNYGGKGIQVCKEWEDFATFRIWARGAGYESHLTIERTNPNKGYMPSNCEWITREENSRRVHNPRHLQMEGIRA